MKMIKSNEGITSPDDRTNAIRSMVLNFREKTLTADDHIQLSAWINENDQNQQLFEKWIIHEFPRRRYKRLGRSWSPADHQPDPGIGLRRPLITLLLFVLFCALVLGAYLFFG